MSFGARTNQEANDWQLQCTSKDIGLHVSASVLDGEYVHGFARECRIEILRIQHLNTGSVGPEGPACGRRGRAFCACAESLKTRN
jgi:hypothetical protein